ncbi:hypothetical protein IKF74_01375 [Candidatus Saccharibacteria bacterium]|nr:hypothetical protein [Candidatus Saccharibacteria bacterium]
MPANSSSPLAVSTGLIEVALTPGEVYEGDFLVLNPATENIISRYSITAAPLNFFDESYTPAFADPSDYNQIVDWVEIAEPKGELKPQEKHTIHYKITVPEDAPAGGQYMSFLVAAADDATSNQQESAAVTAKSRIAILLYSTVAGETREEGTVIENNVGAFFFDQPIKTSSLVINSGNVHIPAKYTLRIYPLFSNEEIYTNEESPKISSVIPDTTLYNEKTWEDTPLLGLFRVEQEIDFGDKYNVKSNLVLVAPTWFVIVCLLFLAALIYAIIDRVKKRKEEKKA